LVTLERITRPVSRLLNPLTVADPNDWFVLGQDQVDVAIAVPFALNRNRDALSSHGQKVAETVAILTLSGVARYAAYSGGFKGQDGVTEASLCREVFRNVGVPDEHIIGEGESLDTAQNALCLAPVFARCGIRSAVLVDVPQHTRRTLYAFRHVMPEIVFRVWFAEGNQWGDNNKVTIRDPLVWSLREMGAHLHTRAILYRAHQLSTQVPAR
jgi:uncharacterized SAM-binding protein YcdF (DUF218 family)